MSEIRLNKYLSEAGLCSRREADRWITDGRVEVNGNLAHIGMRIGQEDRVRVDGKEIQMESEKIILAYYKPKGIVCTFEKKEPNNLIAYLNYPKRITYAGRLDKESEGLLILTNQGNLIQEMMRAANEHEKEYLVTVDQPITRDFIQKLQNGIWLEELGVQTRACKVRQLRERTFEMVLTQGLNRQIRRMCRTCGYHVRKLIRTRIVNIQLGDLEKGQYRNLTDEEIKELYHRIKLERE